LPEAETYPGEQNFSPDILTFEQKYAIFSIPLEYVIAYSVNEHISLLFSQFIDMLFE